jgi:serine/threonine protein kinase
MSAEPSDPGPGDRPPPAPPTESETANLPLSGPLEVAASAATPSETVVDGGADALGGLPRALPGYEILSTLGRGGMGVVYEARQTKLGRIVALKMILSGAHAGEDALARFRTEGEAIARLQHPNIVSIAAEHSSGPLRLGSLGMRASQPFWQAAP